MTKKQSSNDQRSNALNPNNPAYQQGVDNRSRQLNSENPAHDKRRKGNK
ncbi:MAG: hypothetical protein HRT35_06150 [Algicola sp.]|nr:hypothetical protein [Algicola sp.]